MKKLLLTGLFITMFYGLCFADVYLVINKDTKAVITLGEQNDNVLQPNQGLVVLPGTIEELGLTEHPTFYFYKKGKFIKDSDRINQAEVAKQKFIDKARDEGLIAKKLRQLAVGALKVDGVEIKEE
jgi:hypothetical protein